MSIKRLHATEQARRQTAFQLWLKVSAPILAVGLCVTVMTNSALACSGSTIIIAPVLALNSVSFCDVSITNTGTVTGSAWALSYFGATSDTLNNAGAIIATDYGVFKSGGVITSLSNTGTISGDVGIFNASGTITTLNNRQGASSSPLTYRGVLPTNYNIIIASPTNYGKLSALVGTSSTVTFNIYGNTGTTLVSGIAASTVAAGTYNSVLTGLIATNFSGSLSGTYTGGYTWQLVNETGSTTIWNLLVTGSGDSGGSLGSGSGNALNIINFTGGNESINGGTITIGAPSKWPGGSITVGPAGATMVMTSDYILFYGNLILNGPLTIVGPDGRATVLNFYGNLSGRGDLTIGNEKSQTIVSVSGNNKRTGPTYVTQGATLLAKSNWWDVTGTSTPLGSGDVSVRGTAILSGYFPGSVSVTSGGNLYTGGSPGYASYGSLTMGTGSTYWQDIAGKVQANAATINGTAGTYSFANITTGLVIESGTTLTTRLSDLFKADEPGYGSSIYIPVLGDRFRIFTAAGGITGRFTTLTQPAELSSGTQLIAFYNVNNSNSLDLAIAPTSYSSTLSSSTTNAKYVAGVLDQLLGVNKAGTASAAQDSLLYAVAGQDAANLPGFARSLAGEIHVASVATLSQATQRVQQAVLARLGDFPMPPTQLNGAGSNPLSSGAITGNNPSGLPTANMSSNPAVHPNAANITSAAVADGRAWGEIAYQRGERSSNSGGNGFNNNLYQAVFGVDAYTNAELGLKLGGGLALSNTTVNASGGNSTIQQGSLFAYGKMTVLQDYVLDGMASVGLSSTNLSRNDPTGYTGGFSSKAVLGNDALVSVGISRAFEYDEVRVTPYARLSYQYVSQNSYDEGTGAAALNIDRFSGNAVRGMIGVAAGSLNKDPLKDEYTYRANLAIGADSQGLLNPTLNTTLGGYSSSVTTPTAGSTFVQAGLYGTVKVADSAYAYAGVSAEARTSQTLYGGSMGLRVAF
jgi:uncharacterized protein with beta-barrel porin domain